MPCENMVNWLFFLFQNTIHIKHLMFNGSLFYDYTVHMVIGEAELII